MKAKSFWEENVPSPGTDRHTLTLELNKMTHRSVKEHIFDGNIVSKERIKSVIEAVHEQEFETKMLNFLTRKYVTHQEEWDQGDPYR